MADWTDIQLPENIMTTLEVDDLAVNYDISAGTVYSKNSCTAWVNFDGTTTPPTIRDSFNVSDVVRTATGYFDIYFVEDMDNTDYSIAGSTAGDASGSNNGVLNGGGSSIISLSNAKIHTGKNTDNADVNPTILSIQIFGGKN